jgi:hypothetical protein
MGREASLRVASTSASATELTGSYIWPGLQNGESAKVGSGTPPYYLWVSNMCTLCLCNSKSAPVICCVPSVLLPSSLVIVAIAGELNILVKSHCYHPCPNEQSGLAPPSEPASYGCSTTNAQCTRRRQKPEVKVDKLVKIPPFQLAIRVAVPLFFLACSRVTSSTLVSSMKLIRLPLLSWVILKV